MAGTYFKVIQKPAVMTATPLHDGTNNMLHQKFVKGFMIQTFDAAVYFGESSVTGNANGWTVPREQTVNVVGFESRGSFGGYDLSLIYYVGGAFKLIIEEGAR